MIEGRRLTDAATLELITMVYAGKINKKIVAELQALHCNAIGFTGADGNSISSQKRPISTIDYGFVGDITNVETSTLNLLLEQRICAVFCAITHDNKGQLLNTNADTIASELAIAFAKHPKYGGMDFSLHPQIEYSRFCPLLLLPNPQLKFLGLSKMH